MANEANLKERTDVPINFACEDGNEIKKGTVLKLSGARKAAAADSDEDFVAGIAERDKIKDDGVTSIAAFRRGVFGMKASGAIQLGEGVATSSTPNHVKSASAGISGAKLLGTALEQISDGNTGEIFVDVGAGGSA